MKQFGIFKSIAKALGFGRKPEAKSRAEVVHEIDKATPALAKARRSRKHRQKQEPRRGVKALLPRGSSKLVMKMLKYQARAARDLGNARKGSIGPHTLVRSGYGTFLEGTI